MGREDAFHVGGGFSRKCIHTTASSWALSADLAFLPLFFSVVGTPGPDPGVVEVVVVVAVDVEVVVEGVEAIAVELLVGVALYTLEDVNLLLKN